MIIIVPTQASTLWLSCEELEKYVITSHRIGDMFSRFIGALTEPAFLGRNIISLRKGSSMTPISEPDDLFLSETMARPRRGTYPF